MTSKSGSLKVFLMLIFISVVFINYPAFSQITAEKIGKLVNEYCKRGEFNGVILVAEKGKVIYKSARGTANFKWDIPVTFETKFPIYSITKQFTSLIILQLAEEGKISLEGKLSEYLPYYRKDTGNKVTIHHLLSHTHGITPPDWSRVPRFKSFPLEVFTKEYLSGDFEFEPGEGFHYGIGHVILAEVIEKVTGKKYYDVLSERILQPLKMENTGIIFDNKIIKGLAGAYEKRENELSIRQGRSITQAYGASGMYSTVEDLFKWDQALSNDKLISKKNKELMYENYNPDSGRPYGYGFDILTIGIKGKEKKVPWHDGGGVSKIFRIPEDNHLIIMLNNILRGTRTFEIGLKLLHMFYNEPFSMPPRR